MGGDDITVGELDRRLKDLQNGITRIEARLDNYVAQTQHSDLERRVNSLESTYTWISRLIGAIVITALLATIIQNGGL